MGGGEGGGGGLQQEKKRRVKKKKEKKKLTHMALIHNAYPACSESAEDDSTLWWTNDIIPLTREQDDHADNEHT